MRNIPLKITMLVLTGIVSVAASAVSVSAAYAPGQILDPACAPGASGCVVELPWDLDLGNGTITTLYKVGVGTTTPAYDFELTGSSSKIFKAWGQLATSAGAGIEIGDDTFSPGSGFAGIQAVYSGTSSTNLLSIGNSSFFGGANSSVLGYFGPNDNTSLLRVRDDGVGTVVHNGNGMAVSTNAHYDTGFEFYSNNPTSSNDLFSLTSGAFPGGQGNILRVKNNGAATGILQFIFSNGTNTWAGLQAGRDMTTGSGNAFFGHYAGLNVTSGHENTLIGAGAGGELETGTGTTIVGAGAGGRSATSTNNTFMGSGTGRSSFGTENSGFGIGAGYYSRGNGNSSFGAFSGEGHATGSNNTFLGSFTTLEQEDLTGQVNITIGSTTITGIGTQFLSELAVGQTMRVNNEAIYLITSIISDTELTVEEGVLLTSGNGAYNATVYLPVSVSDSIALGRGAALTGNSQWVVGSSLSPISEAYFGMGVYGNGAGIRLNASGGKGADRPGGSLTLAGGRGTGSAIGGSLIFQTSQPTSSGSTPHTMVDRARINAATGFFGINTTVPAYQLSVASNSASSVAGFTNTNGTCVINPNSGSLSCSSDANLKKNIAGFESALDKVMRLAPVRYNWKGESDTEPTRIGFIAQEVQSVFPELIQKQADGYLSMNYAGLTPILTKAVQELNAKVDTMSGGNGSVAISGSSLSDLLMDSASKVINGITRFTQRVFMKELCLEDAGGATCVTRSQLDALLQQTGVTPSYQEEYETPEPVENDTDQEVVLENSGE